MGKLLRLEGETRSDHSAVLFTAAFAWRTQETGGCPVHGTGGSGFGPDSGPASERIERRLKKAHEQWQRKKAVPEGPL